MFAELMGLDDLDVAEDEPSYLTDDAPAVPTKEPKLPDVPGGAPKKTTTTELDEFGLPVPSRS